VRRPTVDSEMHSGRIVGVILGAGKGTRMPPGREWKQFLPLEGKPIFMYSIEVFAASPSVDEIVVVVPPGMVRRTKTLLLGGALDIPWRVMVGGRKRQDSAFKALRWLSGRGDVAYVAIHDAARPLVTVEILEKAIGEAKEYGAAAVAAKTTDTVLEIEGGFIRSIPNRSVLFNAQTPQAFSLDLIWKAHELARRDGVIDATDDVQLVLRAGGKVRLVESPPENMKITVERDLDFASLILKERLWHGHLAHDSRAGSPCHLVCEPVRQRRTRRDGK